MENQDFLKELPYICSKSLHLTTRNYESNQYFAALLGGVAIGAAAGLLLAPEEGKETRRRLKAQGARIADKVNETLRNKGIKLSREDMEDMVDDIADELKPIDD